MSDSSSGSARKKPRSPVAVARSSLSAPTVVEPVRHRLACEAVGDWRVPPLVGQAILVDGSREAFGKAGPSPRDVPGDDPCLASRALLHVAEPAAQDPGQWKSKLPAQLA